MTKTTLVLTILAALAPVALADPPKDAATQIEQGKKLYTEKCASCHGPAGAGNAAKGIPPVVGKDAFPLKARAKQKRDVEFHTAADVFGWASKNMPQKAPGTLTTDEYLAIFAFDLTANGVKLDKPLDGAAAAKIVLHK